MKHAAWTPPAQTRTMKDHRVVRVRQEFPHPDGKDSAMLIPQQAACGPDDRQGCRMAGLAELRRQLAEPSRIDLRTRQRLLELSRRLARVQALGDEYSRVGLSPLAVAALDGAGQA